MQLAEDTFREHTRKLVEDNISKALSLLKSRTRSVYDYNFLIRATQYSATKFVGHSFQVANESYEIYLNYV